MIGTVGTGGSFYHCLSYCLQDKKDLTEEQKIQLSISQGVQHKNRAEVLEYNNCFGDKNELTAQFKEVRQLSRRVEKPLMHLSMRVAPEDHLTKNQLIEIGRACVKEFHLDQNQYVCILHKDTQEQHIHIVANRVGYDGKVASDSHSYARMARLCRGLEKEYKLKQVLSPRRFLSQKERLIPRHDQRKEKLRVHIQQALKGSRRYLDFEKKMEEKGYQVIKGRGIAFIDDKKVRIKGSEVNYSLQIIERILEKQRIQELRQDPVYRQQRQQKISQARQIIGKSLGKHLNHAVNLGQGAAIAGELTGGFANVMAVLMKHEHSHGSLPAELRQEPRKKKKRQRRHW